MRLFLSFIFATTALLATAQQAATSTRTLIVIFDGLRPDYITSGNMPNVHAFKVKGSYASANHSVFPTVTRVNASSYATGSYPARHGLMGNTVYFPSVDKTHGLNTGEAEVLMTIAKATDNNLLTTVSLGEILHQAGSSMMVFSSGSTGQAFLQNHRVPSGGVVNPEFILPESLKQEVYKNIGDPPSADAKKDLHAWAARALLHYATKPDGPLVSAIWFSDPDGAAHSKGIGSPEGMASIKVVDEQFGFILKTLESNGLLNKYNIIVTADHGFVTHKGKVSLGAFLRQEGLKESADSEDVVLAGNAVYVKDHDREKIKKIVDVLQRQPWVGAIFTRSDTKGSSKGWVEGTLSFESIHWDHERAGDILVDYNWDHEKNARGYKGSSFATGVAGHGGSSSYEIHIPLIASGPAFRRSYESALPTSNIDIVPTILHIMNLPVATSMDGRVMDELLRSSGKQKPAVVKETLEASVNRDWGSYHIKLHRSRVGKQQYVDFTDVVRKLSNDK